MSASDLKVFAIQLAFLFPLIAIALLTQRSIKWGYLAAAFAYLFADACLTGYGADVRLPVPMHWNWIGKAASILLSAAILIARPDLREPSGAVLRQRPSSRPTSLALVALLFAAGAYFGSQDSAIAFNLETPLYQATMPGFAEELAFRGIALCLLNRALGKIGGSNVGWGVLLMIVLFGAGHAVYWADDSIQVAWMAFVMTGAIGAVLMCIRLNSGSLVFPIIGHGAMDVPATCIAMLK